MQQADLDLMDFATSFASTVNLVAGGSATEIVGSSPSRIAIIFWPPATGSYTAGLDPAVTVNRGFVLTPTSGPLTLHISEHGDAVIKPWYGINNNTTTLSSGDITVSFLQTILPVEGCP